MQSCAAKKLTGQKTHEATRKNYAALIDRMCRI